MIATWNPDLLLTKADWRWQLAGRWLGAQAGALTAAELDQFAELHDVITMAVPLEHLDFGDLPDAAGLSEQQRTMPAHDWYTAMRAEADEELAAAFETVTSRAWEVAGDGVR